VFGGVGTANSDDIKIATPKILDRLLAVLQSPMTITHVVIDPDDDVIVIQWQLHFYRFHRSTGRIERVTDKAKL